MPDLRTGPEHGQELHEPVDDDMGQGDEAQEPEARPPNLGGQSAERFQCLHEGAPNQATADRTPDVGAGFKIQAPNPLR